MINDKEEKESNYKVEYLGEKYSQDFITYKVIILGLYGVGKTSIIIRFMKKGFDEDNSSTITVDIKNFQVKVNDKIIQIQIWDSCGNDEFAKSTPNLFKNASIAILVYAINDKQSFEDLEKWYNILKEYCYDHKIFLIGNKSDLKEERIIESEKGETFKNNYENIKMFFETSALKGENIDKLLENIAISIYEKNEIDEKNFEKGAKELKSIQLNKKNHRKRRKKKFCF